MKTNPSLVDLREQEFDVEIVRNDFPVLSQLVFGKPLVYFDNAATSQKPLAVINALTEYYSSYNANIHRGVHYLSQKASQAFDDVRVKVANFIRAKSENEIVFVRGTTEGINLVASSYGRKNFNKGDEVLISEMEHHSNIVPWQMICEERGAILKIIPINDAGEIVLEEYQKLLNEKTKFVSIVHTSNSLGTINPVKEMIRMAHAHNIPVLVDAAQAVVHETLDVQDLDCDFLCFSSHKMLGPTGIGVLYGKLDLLEAMPPYQGGGEMIQSVTFSKTTYNEVPYKFEAGTPNIADVIAFGTAIRYLSLADRNVFYSHEQKLLAYAINKLSGIEGIRFIGEAKKRTSLVSFVIEGLNALDIGMYLDTLGIAVRTGHHCTEPVMDRMKVPGTIRASFMFYNTFEEIDKLKDGIEKAIRILRK
ncbi:MAG: cysteine desulfurase [Bacteroidia bacterium]|nr:cysteine desulfurase [Bacteroidia bacterium]